MMNRIGIKFYTLQLTERHRQNASPEALEHFGLNQDDFFVVVNKYLQHLPTYLRDKKRVEISDKKQKIERSFFLKNWQSDNDGRMVSGVVWCGNSGYAAPFIDMMTLIGEYERKTYSAELIPLYFLFSMPKNKRTGVLAVQTFGRHSLRQELMFSLREYFNSLYDTHLIRAKSLMLGELFIDKYITGGKLKTIEFIRYIAPKDKATKDWDKNRAKCSLFITPIHRMMYLPDDFSRFLSRINKSNVDKKDIIRAVSSIYEVDLPDDCEDINFFVTFNGQKRKLNVDDIVDCASHYDITDQVSIGPDGHPDFTEVDRWVKHMVQTSVNKIIQE